MALGFYFQPEGMTAQKYDAVMNQLEAAGQGAPAGRVHHSCFGPADAVMVFDVWNSREEFETFGETLVPILKDNGIEIGQFDVMPVHNLIQ
jgi:hypothetical protein